MSTNHLSKKQNLTLLLLLVMLFSSCTRVANHDCLITNVNIVDVKTGRILKNKTIGIDSNRISAIYDKEIPYSDSAIVIDGYGKYLIPGLWDMHAHYKWSHNVDLDPLLIANGITGLREMWGDCIIDIPPKKQREILPSPDIYTSGDLIDGNPPSFPGIPGSIVVTTPDEAVAAVDRQVEKKVDFVKIYSSLSEECFMAISKETKKKNIPFAGHIPINVSIYKAIDAGMVSWEHLHGFLYACSSESEVRNSNVSKPNEEVLGTFSEERFDSLCSVLAKSKMWLCPTFTVLRALGSLNDTTFTNDKRMTYLPGYILTMWDQQTKWFDESGLKDSKERFLFELKLIGEMNKRGVKLLSGTDFPNPYVFPGFSLHDELSLMVNGGLSSLEALKAATLNAAIFMNRENDFGSVEAGKIASLVLLNKNPLENIENTKSIEAVILRGRVFDRARLNGMLQIQSNTIEIPESH